MRYDVVIPAFNAAATVAEAVRSVLGHEPAPARIHLVDDGSRDGTADIAASLDARVVVTRQPNRGAGWATTTGIGLATAPFIAFLDADDIWLPGKIARQAERFAAWPGLDGVFAHARRFRERDGAREEGAVQPIWGRTTFVVRREAALRVGPMIDPPGMRGEMVDWIARARETGLAFEMLPDVLALRRIHPGSLSYGRDRERDRGYLLTARAAIQRRRQRQAAPDPDEPAPASQNDA
ncbi:MAG: glycosyltransferase family A protein [Azospirillaceae bacterium]